MKFANVDYTTAHNVVESNNALSWDGWTIVEWKKNPDGFWNKFGSQRNNVWGVERRMAVQDDGTWKVPAKYVAG